ncbi:uncharacterized protein [Musca autumnalis]|uniref:uncharacterized protein n=1 Tax=Musca autumnalis TaxID=221902 RepID=UPI003CEA9A15
MGICVLQFINDFLYQLAIAIKKQKYSRTNRFQFSSNRKFNVKISWKERRRKIRTVDNKYIGVNKMKFGIVLLICFLLTTNQAFGDDFRCYQCRGDNCGSKDTMSLVTCSEETHGLTTSTASTPPSTVSTPETRIYRLHGRLPRDVSQKSLSGSDESTTPVESTTTSTTAGSTSSSTTTESNNPSSTTTTAEPTTSSSSTPTATDSTTTPTTTTAVGSTSSSTTTESNNPSSTPTTAEPTTSSSSTPTATDSTTTTIITSTTESSSSSTTTESINPSSSSTEPTSTTTASTSSTDSSTSSTTTSASSPSESTTSTGSTDTTSTTGSTTTTSATETSSSSTESTTTSASTESTTSSTTTKNPLNPPGTDDRFACYSVKYLDDGDTITEKGCVAITPTQTACEVVKTNTGVPLEKCDICLYSDCNSSSTFKLSTIAVLGVVLVKILFHHL